MKHLYERIKTTMASQNGNRFSSLEFFLYLASILYGWAVGLRTAGYRKGLIKAKRLPGKVISIGNLTVGGTGKTPMALYVSNLVKRLGFRVAVVSRGYKGGAEKSGGIVSDGKAMLMGPEEAGDEPFMMAQELKHIPVIVGRNRYVSGRLAIEAFGSNVIVLDDAFQHLQLERDLDLVLLDSCRPVGNSYLLPRGTLREPIAALSRADAFVMTRWDPAFTDAYERVRQWADGRPVFKSYHIPKICRALHRGVVLGEEELQRMDRYNANALKQYCAFAFSGIARNEDFVNLLNRLELDIAGFRGFPDHHQYSRKELEDIFSASKTARCDVILTTTKDFVRISHQVKWPLDLLALGIETTFGDDRDVFERFIASRLKG